MAIVSSARAGTTVAPRTGGGAAAHQFEEAGRTVVCVHGEIDVGTVGTLDAVLGRAATQCSGEIVVDLGQVRFMDAAGLRRILAMRDELLASGRPLMVRNTQGVVQRLFSILDAEDLIEA